jgi:hypothetical protein
MGMDVATSTSHVSTELPRTMSSRDLNPASTLDNGDPIEVLPSSYWRDVLREFRNHLSIVVARSSELSTVLPGAAAAQAGDCLADIEVSAARMEGMLTWMDAALTPGAPTIVELGEVLARAVQLAAPAIRPRIEVRVEARPAAVRNRGATLESALAALLIELTRGPEPFLHAASPGRSRSRESSAARLGDALGEPTIIRLSTREAHGELFITLTTTGAIQLIPSSWRLCLARALLASVSGVVEVLPGGAEFEVRFSAL